MKLTLNNIGKIGTAAVEINGITIIAGENNTGKSTVGRALFAVLNSFCDVQKQIENERVDSVENLLDLYMSTKARFARIVNMNTADVAKTIVAHIDSYRQIELPDMQKSIIDLISQYSDGKNEFFDENMVVDTALRIKDVLNVSDIDFLKSMLERKLNAEFNGQVCNIFSEDDGKIQLQIKDKIITVSVEKEGSVDIHNLGDISLGTEVVYIDDPFVLDDLNMFYLQQSASAGHRYHLQKKLFELNTEANVFDEIIIKNKLNSIYEKISSVCSGDVIQSKHSGMGYQRKGSDKVLNVRNLSTGLKTFVILKMLLANGAIERNGTIILDEPEIHLHPEWQLLFAELIVLIQKEFGVHVLLNTHNPYFLRAIQVYSAKYESADTCKYYLSEVFEDQANITDVTDDIDKIYAKLSRPLQRLEGQQPHS